MESLAVQFIGQVHSPFKEKFAIPRQPGLCQSVAGRIEIFPEFKPAESLRGLEKFSHIWVVFAFHGTAGQGWKSLVRPPRLGGNDKLGVFATRSTFRPNPVGMSAVKLSHISEQDGKYYIHIQGHDLMDGTPVIDIKPYVAYSDSLSSAQSSFAQLPPESAMKVSFDQLNEEDRSKLSEQQIKAISEILSQDPRPAYKRNKADPNTYGVHFDNLNICWQVVDDIASITTIEVID